MKNQSVVVGLCTGFALALLGCGSEAPTGEGFVSEGIVGVDEHGAPSVRYVQVPKADFELAVKAKTLLAQGGLKTADAGRYLAEAGYQSDLDLSCNVNSMWIHEQTYQQGPILCFAENANPGFTNIADYNFSDGNPGTAGKSFWAGSRPGIFLPPQGNGPQFIAFQQFNSFSLAWYPYLIQN